MEHRMSTSDPVDAILGVVLGLVLGVIVVRGSVQGVVASRDGVMIRYIHGRRWVPKSSIKCVFTAPYAGFANWSGRSRLLRMPCIQLVDGSVIDIQPLTARPARARRSVALLAASLDVPAAVPVRDFWLDEI